MGTIQRQNGTNGAENHGLYRLRSKNFSLGDRAGVKQTYIYELERGRTNITLNTLVKMADVLGMDVRDLLPQTGPSPLSLVVLERLMEVCGRIASILSARQKQDAELLAAFRAFADLHTDFENALKSERPPAGSL